MKPTCLNKSGKEKIFLWNWRPFLSVPCANRVCPCLTDAVGWFHSLMLPIWKAGVSVAISRMGRSQGSLLVLETLSMKNTCSAIRKAIYRCLAGSVGEEPTLGFSSGHEPTTLKFSPHMALSTGSLLKIPSLSYPLAPALVQMHENPFPL